MRTYGDRCGVARALDVVGERWALLIVRDLLLGPKRFTDLRRTLPGVSPDVLSQRLRELEAAGVVNRATLPPPAASKVYELTERGRELEPVVLALGRWGSGQPLPADGATFGADAFVVALKTMFQSSDSDAYYQLHLGGEAFALAVADGELVIERGTRAPAELTIDGEPSALAAWLWHEGPEDGLSISGPAAAVRRFRRLFSP